MNKETIYKEITSIPEPYAVFATLDGNKPQAATMYFICNENLDIFFMTKTSTRKYGNLMQNPNMAFVLTGDHPPKTIQIEGKATEVMDPNEQLTYYGQLVEKARGNVSMPPIEQIAAGEVVFMKLVPEWIRCGNFELHREGDHFLEVAL